MKFKNKLIVSIIFVAFLGLGKFLYSENNLLEKSVYSYESKKIPKSFDRFKILQVSDLHNKNFGKNNKRLFELIDGEKPDIIIITGDVYYSYKDKINNSLKFLEKIAQKYPVYFVTGNHEQRDKNWLEHSKMIESYGIKILDNKIEKIEKEGEFIQIYGLKDPSFYNKSVRYKVFERHLKEIVKKLDKNNLAILLTHRPERFKIYVKNHVDLLFAGHAHGGQVRIFGKGLLTPGEGFFPDYTGGIYSKKDTTMILSRGLGRTIFTTRIFNRPEIVVTTLVSK